MGNRAKQKLTETAGSKTQHNAHKMRDIQNRTGNITLRKRHGHVSLIQTKV